MQITIFWAKRLLCLALVSVLLFSLVPLRVSALSTAQQQLMLSGLYNFDIVASCGSNTNGSTSDSGADSSDTSVDNSSDIPPNAQEAFVYFSSKSTGFSAAQAAGLVGNLWAESSINPTTVNSIGATGIAQWLNGRLTAMRTWVAGENKDPRGLSGQMDFVMHELNTSEATSKTDLLKQTTANGAAYVIFADYERPGDDSLPTRQQHARTILAKFGSLAGSDTPTTASETTANPSDTSTTCASTDAGGAVSSVDCTSATGTAKILCQAKAYEGIYYRWGGGHQGYDAFIAGCKDPSNPGTNTPHGAPADPTNGGESGNPSPCATDCSGLVSIAVDSAFNKKFIWTVGSLEADSANWKQISKSEIQPGDVLTKGDYHIEIVDHMPQGDQVYTFGSHETGTKTGMVESSINTWTGAYRYVGPQ